MVTAEKRRPRRGFGTIRKLPSGRFQTTYIGPDLGRHAAPFTFDARGYAERWLEEERRIIQLEEWTAPAAREAIKLLDQSLTLRVYATQWFAARVLRPNTQKDYRHLIEDVILPGLGDLRLHDLTRGTCVDGGPASMAPNPGPTRRPMRCCERLWRLRSTRRSSPPTLY